MIVERSQVSLTATHLYQEQRSVSERLRAWVGDPPASDAGHSDAGVAARPASVPAARAMRSHPSAAPDGIAANGSGEHGRVSHQSDRALRRTSLTGRLEQLVALIEHLTGQRVQVLDPAELGDGPAPAQPAPAPAPAPASDGGLAPAESASQAGWGLDYQRTETSLEQEATGFHASGSVTTSDGKQIDVGLDLQLYRQVAQSSTVRLTAGDAVVKDPLVLSFGVAPSLSGGTVGLDLDGDGVTDKVPFVGAGSAFLALDRNGNGIVDGGGELFGPSSGDGFGELAGYDADGNGWIDSADPVFSQLRLWQDPSRPLSTLADGGVGAIGVTAVATPFTLAGPGQGETQTAGVLRSSGIWLGEDGSVGSVHQVDLQT